MIIRNFPQKVNYEWDSLTFISRMNIFLATETQKAQRVSQNFFLCVPCFCGHLMSVQKPAYFYALGKVADKHNNQ